MAQKNKHLTHLEDRILTDGKGGAQEAIEMLKMMGEFLDGKAGPQPLVTTKWDGAPAVICGTDPADGRFFVGTKSVFAKDSKLCKSPQDIDTMYSGELAQKLHAAFKYLNGKVKGVIQGDLMFTDDLKRERIEGRNYVSFRPNTLTYAARTDSPLGREIMSAKLGIVFHTKYTGPSLAEMSASFNVTEQDYESGGPVWAQKATYQDISGAANMSPQERKAYDAAVRRAEGSYKQVSSFLNKIIGHKTKIDDELLKFFNAYVKQGQTIPSVQKASSDFLRFVGGEIDKQVSKRSTYAGQNAQAIRFLEIFFFIEANQNDFNMMLALYMNLQYCKNILVRQLQKVQGLRIFADMGGTYKVTTPEGFVAVKGDRAVKLVDRLEFSRLNFTIPKKWDK
jgi:hypothetical protein